MNEFIENLPKAELHLHIEGSFEPELMFKIAKRNNIEIPFKTIKEIEDAYQFSCLQDFLDIYYQGANVLQTEEDFFDLTFSYLIKCNEQNVRHTEIMFDPQTHTERGIPFKTVITGIVKAQEKAKEEFGITSLLIMSFLRHLSEDAAFKTLEESLPYKDKITCVGLDSSEKGNPPSKFKNVYAKAIEIGYIPVAHAGEEGDADYVWEAIDILKVKRIDHGNNALQDKKLVQEIIKRDIALTVCPLSNTALKVVDDLKDHPIKKMLNLGLKATINSDDPAFFGGQVNKNYIEVQKALDLNKEDIYTLAKNSFQYSFLKDNTKQKYLTELETYYQNNK